MASRLRPIPVVTLALLLACAMPASASSPSRYHQAQQHADALYDAGDYQAAMKAYLKLAKKGDSFSQYRVSYMRLEGLGDEEDVVEAFAWAYLAAQNRQKALLDYRDAVGRLVPAKQRRKAERRVDYYMRKWGNLAIADDAIRGARHELRTCTGSRLGTRCEDVYAMEMPKFWGISPGNSSVAQLSGAVESDGGSAAVSGSVSSGQTGGGGGAVRDVGYYRELRERLRALDRYIGEHGGNVELGDFEVLDDEPDPAESPADGR